MCVLLLLLPAPPQGLAASVPLPPHMLAGDGWWPLQGLVGSAPLVGSVPLPSHVLAG